jgi:hypothetical protein
METLIKWALILFWYWLWTVISVAVFLYVSVPIGMVVGTVGVVGGLSVVVYGLVMVLSGRVSPDVLTPAGVAAGRLPGRVDPVHVRRDRAWPNYFTAQVYLDVKAITLGTAGLVLPLWTRSAQPLRTRTVRKVFYGWPAIAIVVFALAGLTAGATAALLVATAVIAVVTAVAWTLGLATAAVLRAVDRAWQFVFRATASCPRCYHVTRLPAYHCPGPHPPHDRVAGDDLHRDLRPGRLGVLWRRCACGHRLPTTVLRAAHGLEARCPICTAILHPRAGVVTDVRVPVFGATSSGKTHLIVSAVIHLLDAGETVAVLIDEHSRRRAADFRSFVDRDRGVPKTDAATMPVAMTLQLAGSRPALLHLFDAAGEALADPAVSSGYAYLDHARTLIFVLDPFSVPAVHDRFAAQHTAVFAEANPAGTDPEASYQATVGRLRISGVPTETQRLAVVLTKRDLLARLPLDRETDGAISGTTEPATADVRDWLLRQGLDNLVLSAERDFAEVRYFAVSSLERSASGAIAPVRWLLSTDRVPLAAPPPRPTPPIPAAPSINVESR